MRLLVTRPKPDAQALVDKLKALGHEGIAAPMLEVEFLDFSPLQMSNAQALIATSRNALRALAASDALEAASQLPLYVVSAATADLAQELGFSDIHDGPGTAQDLLLLIKAECPPGEGILIHLAGTRLAFDLKSALEEMNFQVELRAMYQARSAEKFNNETLTALAEGELNGVILMSPMTAQTFVTIVDASDLLEQAAKLSYFCLSQNVAEPLNIFDGARILIADKPSENDLLALIAHEAAN